METSTEMYNSRPNKPPLNDKHTYHTTMEDPWIAPHRG